MKCDKFRCVYEIDGECEAVGDLCENFGECITCQQQNRKECDGLK